MAMMFQAHFFVLLSYARRVIQNYVLVDADLYLLSLQRSVTAEGAILS